MKRFGAVAAVMCVAIVILIVALAAKMEAQAGKTLTSDPLTGLPLIPSKDPLHLGNEPQVIDPSMICKSNVLTDFYSPTGIKMTATIAWYTEKLTGFKKTEATVRGDVHVMFYKPDRTIIVAINSQRAIQGGEPEVRAITYSKLNPPPEEKAIPGMNTGNIVCP